MEDKNYKIELENELFQEGFLGLMEAQQRKKKKKGIKFTTFAYPYIKGYCRRYYSFSRGGSQPRAVPYKNVTFRGENVR